MEHKAFMIAVLILLLLAGGPGVSASATSGCQAGSIAPAGPAGLLAFAPQAPGWQQVNSDGFGDPDAVEVSAVEAFNGYLYAGTSNAIDGARIFRSQDGGTWNPVTQPGFGIAHDYRPPAILDLTVFNGYLYASTGRGDGPGQIWRTVNGVSWAPMTITGFSNPDTVDITALAVSNNFIFAGANNLIQGAQIWRSNSGDNNTWTQVGPVVTTAGGARVTGFAVFGGALYAAVESGGPVQIWRSIGGDWTIIVSDGFANSRTTSSGGMMEFAGFLYAGVGNDVDGAQLWRTGDGVKWQQANQNGFGDPNNQKVEAVFVSRNLLYASVKNVQTGLELWRSADGVTWEQANLDGFGNKNNTGSNGSNAIVEFLGDLYVGTANSVDGGQLWRLRQEPGVKRYLPLVLR